MATGQQPAFTILNITLYMHIHVHVCVHDVLTIILCIHMACMYKVNEEVWSVDDICIHVDYYTDVHADGDMSTTPIARP